VPAGSKALTSGRGSRQSSERRRGPRRAASATSTPARGTDRRSPMSQCVHLSSSRRTGRRAATTSVLTRWHMPPTSSPQGASRSGSTGTCSSSSPWTSPSARMSRTLCPVPSPGGPSIRTPMRSSSRAMLAARRVESSMSRRHMHAGSCLAPTDISSVRRRAWTTSAASAGMSFQSPAVRASRVARSTRPHATR